MFGGRNIFPIQPGWQSVGGGLGGNLASTAGSALVQTRWHSGAHLVHTGDPRGPTALPRPHGRWGSVQQRPGVHGRQAGSCDVRPCCTVAVAGRVGCKTPCGWGRSHPRVTPPWAPRPRRRPLWSVPFPLTLTKITAIGCCVQSSGQRIGGVTMGRKSWALPVGEEEERGRDHGGGGAGAVTVREDTRVFGRPQGPPAPGQVGCLVEASSIKRCQT